jgi:hypothetical protein
VRKWVWGDREREREVLYVCSHVSANFAKTNGSILQTIPDVTTCEEKNCLEKKSELRFRKNWEKGEPSFTDNLCHFEHLLGYQTL